MLNLKLVEVPIILNKLIICLKCFDLQECVVVLNCECFVTLLL